MLVPTYFSIIYYLHVKSAPFIQKILSITLAYGQVCPTWSGSSQQFGFVLLFRLVPTIQVCPTGYCNLFPAKITTTYWLFVLYRIRNGYYFKLNQVSTWYSIRLLPARDIDGTTFFDIPFCILYLLHSSFSYSRFCTRTLHTVLGQFSMRESHFIFQFRVYILNLSAINILCLCWIEYLICNWSKVLGQFRNCTDWLTYTYYKKQ